MKKARLLAKHSIGTSEQLKIDISEDFLSRNFIIFGGIFPYFTKNNGIYAKKDQKDQFF